MCGGDPKLQPAFDKVGKYSPRVWRWSYASSINAPTLIVFSTCVEVIPITAGRQDRQRSILHVCGGDPKIEVPFAVSL